eukprot:CAMPEP_0198253642 /NCGR_PEP_ID=MMETSP1447-20131203/4037_1 /TAXON_ID=420782 /ORGANISM="Chaetoceros dichaeta, Strain CCMP1751" /LENGTH=524 /DNA_ID=CAMNT_0043939399 /DNA_START=87 /DNA_END=1661 /DNA_ORIENTATION=+
MIVLLPILSSLLIGTVTADTRDHVNSNLQIQIPSTLSKEGGYEHREALFGTPPYGGSINQPLIYADSDLCDATVDRRKGYPTRDKDDSGQMIPWPSPFILMVDRGTCSFVQKVRNAQHVGAAGVIIADNICICTDEVCMAASLDNICERAEPIMADDGSGGDIDIPAFLIMKHDADIIKTEMVDNNQNIQIQMKWTLPQQDDRVEYELWTVPSEHVSKDFQKNWKSVAEKFKDHIYFTPREYVYDGERIDCLAERNRNMCNTLCTNNRRYCAMDPDFDVTRGISGREVVIESLRRICVWKHYGESDGIGLKYWDYINNFLEKCDSPDFFASENCVNDVYKLAKMDSDIIKRCMIDSGGTEGDNINTFLDLEIKAQERRGVVVLPTIFVNAVALRGALTENTVIHAICAGFLDGTAPDICNQCSGCSNIMLCVQSDGTCDGPSGSNSRHSDGDTVSKRSFGFTLLIVFAMFGTGAYLHWKKSKEDMRGEVRGILSEYMPLEGNGGDDHGLALGNTGASGSTSFLG